MPSGPDDFLLSSLERERERQRQRDRERERLGVLHPVSHYGYIRERQTDRQTDRQKQGDTEREFDRSCFPQDKSVCLTGVIGVAS